MANGKNIFWSLPNYRIKEAWEKLKGLIPETETMITTLTIRSSLKLITKWYILFDTELDRMVTTREFFFQQKYRQLLRGS